LPQVCPSMQKNVLGRKAPSPPVAVIPRSLLVFSNVTPAGKPIPFKIFFPFRMIKGYDSIYYMSKFAVTDIIMTFAMLPSEDIAAELAVRLKSRRLAQNLTLEGLAKRSGVPLGTLKKFERTGQIALKSFIRLAVVMKDEAALEKLLLEQPFETLGEVLGSGSKPKRGRIK